jgi:uncharacterized protein YceH (UPF0502 family)
MELTAAEGRVLGCLIEQEAVAPDAVPLTLNALRLACNQPVGRDPVVAYDDRTVEDTLLALKSRGLARFVPPTKDVRTTRYRHRADERWRMGPAELAVLAVLLLRGVQTVSEVRAQVQRIHPLTEPGEVDALLDTLAARTPKPFAARVGRRPGDHEIRWVQVLTGPVPDDVDDAPTPATEPGRAVSRVQPEVASPSYAALVARVADLEQRLAASLERGAAGEWATPPFPPPPPPPVEVRPIASAQLGRGDDRRDVRPAPTDDRRYGGPTYPPVGDGRRGDRRYDAADLEELADRLSDIERRLARIEAELGALR